jgi:hypothetical protein
MPREQHKLVAAVTESAHPVELVLLIGLAEGKSFQVDDHHPPERTIQPETVSRALNP